jgi:hypothetical protein
MCENAIWLAGHTENVDHSLHMFMKITITNQESVSYK